MTRVVWKTATSPGAGSFNEIYFEDKKDAEEMFLNASKDMNVMIQNLKNDTVYQDSQRSVSGNHDLTVAKDFSETVANDQTVDISGNEKLTAKSGRGESVGGNEKTTISGDRELDVGQEHATKVNGKRKLKVGGGLTETTKGLLAVQCAKSTVEVTGSLHRTTEAAISEDVGTESTQEISGKKVESAKRSRTLEVQKDLEETVEGSMTLTTKGKYIDNAEKEMSWDVATELAGEAPEIWIEATKKIQIKCGASILIIDTKSIKIQAAEVDLSGARLWAYTSEIKHG
jgi:type VI secretion system secreted protein VgrG